MEFPKNGLNINEVTPHTDGIVAKSSLSELQLGSCIITK